MAYRYADPTDRWKAITAVVLIHAGLGAVMLSGLNVRFVNETVERLKTFDVAIPKPPPPPPPPPPKEQPRDERSEAGAPEKKPSPSPVVVPKPKIVIPTPNPVVAADVAGTGNARTAGAGGRGTGTGNGGTGTGTGSGDGRGFTPAQRVSKIPNSEYRRFVSLSGMSRGSVGITVKVETDGSTSHCRIIRSSGRPDVDSLMCQLTTRFVRFRPARDPQGRPVASDVSWFPDWTPNR